MMGGMTRVCPEFPFSLYSGRNHQCLQKLAVTKLVSVVSFKTQTCAGTS